ncbi:MAG: hypothetical protein ACRDV0_06615 [Acidimicrobiales bacterium]
MTARAGAAFVPAEAAPAVASAGTTRLAPVVTGASVVFAGAAVGQVAGFVFNAVGAHALGPTRYGTLAASLALLSLASPLFTAAQTVASRETTSLISRGESSLVPARLRRYGTRAALGAALLGLLVVLASRWVSSVFHLGSAWFVVIVGATIPCYMVGHVLGGVLQGAERFHRFALESVVEGAAKAVLGVLAVAVVFHSAVIGMAAVMCSCALGCLTYVVLTVPVVRRLARVDAPVGVARAATRGRTSPGIVGYSVTALATYGLLSLMLSVDTLVAKHYLPGRLAGLYAGISVTGKIDFFATSALFVVVFPLFSRHHDQGGGARRSVLASGAVVASVSGVIVAALALRPSWVVAPLLGSRYHAADGYVAWMAAIFSLYALSYLLSTYLLARRRRSVIALLAATFVVQLAGFFVFHSTIADLMGVLAVSFGFLLVGAALLAGHAPAHPGVLPAGAAPTSAWTGAASAGRGLSAGWDEVIVTEVTRAVGPAPVLLSGSRALGTASPASDCDVSVVISLWRTVRTVARLGRVSERLSAELGVRVSVNPVPRFRLLRPSGSLFVDKLAAEAVVLAAPSGWSLPRRRPNGVTSFAASSALLSAVQELLRGFDTRAMSEGAPSGSTRSLRKAVLLIAQVRLLRTGAYESDLDAALTRLGASGSGASGDGAVSVALGARLARALAEPDPVDGFVGVRECALGELGDATAPPLSMSRGAALVRNAQYAVVARLRGRPRWGSLLTTRSAEMDLARVQVDLLGALSPGAARGLDDARWTATVSRLPRVLAGHASTWEALRDATLVEWGDAHPLVGLCA